jgi:hypothetical protein
MTTLVNSFNGGTDVLPPGFLSPAAFPFPNSQFALPNAPQSGVPQPYYAGSGRTTGTTNQVTASVTTPTGAGDAIVAMVDYYSSMGSVTSVTDTQGNFYSIFPTSFAGNNGVLACVAQNTKPLSPANGDSVTVTFSSTVNPVVNPQVFLTGCPAGTLSPPGGNSWLTVTDSRSLAEGGGGSLNLTSSGVTSSPAVIIACTSSTAGTALYPQNWTVLASANQQASPAYYGTSVAARVISSPIAPGTAVLSVQSPSTAASVAGSYVVLQLETRFASQPALMPGSGASPPGLMSPGAWPVFPLEIGEVNDVPPVTPQPYLIAQGSNGASGTTVTVPVQVSSGAGDVIIVSGASTTGMTSVSDTRGNVYALATWAATPGKPGLFIAQNTAPLGTGDSVTVTFASTSAAKSVVVIGAPLGCYTTAFPQAPAGPYLTYDTTYAPGTNTRNGVAVNAGGSAVLSPALGVAAVNRPEVVIAVFITAGGSSPSFGQDWTPVASFLGNAGSSNSVIVIAYKLVTSSSQGTSAVWSLQPPAAGGYLMQVALYPETRVASQPGLASGPPAPPGFISPASAPDTPPFLPGTVNAPYNGLPAPYFVAAGLTTVTNSSITVPVQNATSAGDAVIISLSCEGASGPVTSCTDTQGNSYGMTASSVILNPNTIQYVAQNSRPLTAADSITVTFGATDFHPKMIIITGCPAGTVASQPGSSWLTNTASGSGLSGGALGAPFPLALSQAVSGPAVLIACITPISSPGFPLLPQGWTVIWSSGSVGTYSQVVAVKFTSSYIAANSTLIYAQQTVAGNITGVITALQLETRVAPNRPAPDMPPGMLSPGAWQYQPMPRAIGSLALPVTPLVLSGSGTFTATGQKTAPGAAALSGSGTFTATGQKKAPGAVSLTGSGTFAGTGQKQAPGAALLSGSGLFTASGQKTVPGAAPMAGSGSLLAGWTVTAPGAAHLSGSGGIAAAGTVSAQGSASLSAPAVLTVAALRRAQGQGTLTGSGALLAAPKTLHHASTALAAPGAMAATGTRKVLALAAFSAAPAMTCSPLSVRIIMATDTMFPANQSGTYGATGAETTVAVPGVIDGIYT